MGQQCQMHHQQVESVQRNCAHFTCRDYRRTSSVTKCCSGIHTSSQEVAISILDQKVWNEIHCMCRFSAIQAHADSFRVQSGCGPILPVDIWQLPPGSFKTHLNSFRFIWAPDYVHVFINWTALFFYPKLLFTVCWCSAFSIHICLSTRGAILLEIESAPWSEDEAGNLQQSGGWGDGASSVFYRRKFSFGKIPFLGGVAQW